MSNTGPSLIEFEDLRDRVEALEQLPTEPGLRVPLRCSAWVCVNGETIQCSWYGLDRVHSGYHTVIAGNDRISWLQSKV